MFTSSVLHRARLNVRLASHGATPCQCIHLMLLDCTSWQNPQFVTKLLNFACDLLVDKVAARRLFIQTVKETLNIGRKPLPSDMCRVKPKDVDGALRQRLSCENLGGSGHRNSRARPMSEGRLTALRERSAWADA
jgi:hypothetical protein